MADLDLLEFARDLASAVLKLRAADERGATLSLDENEVSALLKALRSLSKVK